jgi:hypothetical protein
MYLYSVHACISGRSWRWCSHHAAVRVGDATPVGAPVKAEWMPEVVVEALACTPYRQADTGSLMRYHNICLLTPFVEGCWTAFLAFWTLALYSFGCPRARPVVVAGCIAAAGTVQWGLVV